MSDSRRVEGERVFCHQCSHEWDRAHGGLTCPSCSGEFVEILSNGAEDDGYSSGFPSGEPSPPLPRNAFQDHNPWENAPDPDEGDITTFQFNTRGGGRGTVSFGTRSFINRGNNVNDPVIRESLHVIFYGPDEEDLLTTQPGMQDRPLHPLFGDDPFGLPRLNMPGGLLNGGFQAGGAFSRDVHAQTGPGNMQDLFSMIFQTMQQRNNNIYYGAQDRPPNPFDFLTAIMNPGLARQGDAVWTQEAFDEVLEQLAAQNQGTAPGPAADSAIRALPTKQVDESMMGNDGKAECSICMDNVAIGDDVTVLPCNHWFHRDCVTAWLKEHDTCPHCRAPTTKPGGANAQGESSRRQSSRRPSSVASPHPASPLNPFGPQAFRTSPVPVPDSPRAVREARQQYYGMRRDAELERPPSHRHSSSQSDRNRSNRDSGGNAGGGVSGWIRNRMNLG